MRPDDYWAADAERFTEAVQLRNAIQAGEEAARERHSANQAATKMI